MNEQAPAIEDIDGPLQAATREPWLLLACVAAAVLLALLIFGIWWWKKRGQRDPVVTARDHARRALQQLRTQLPHMEPYPFSIAVSDVLRGFFAAQHGIAAPQQTSREFLDALHQRSTLAPTEEGRLREFLEGCDLIKFAGVTATVSDSERLLNQAEALVEGGAS